MKKFEYLNRMKIACEKISDDLKSNADYPLSEFYKLAAWGFWKKSQELTLAECEMEVTEEDLELLKAKEANHEELSEVISA